MYTAGFKSLRPGLLPDEEKRKCSTAKCRAEFLSIGDHSPKRKRTQGGQLSYTSTSKGIISQPPSSRDRQGCETAAGPGCQRDTAYFPGQCSAYGLDTEHSRIQATRTAGCHHKPGRRLHGQSGHDEPFHPEGYCG